MYLLLRRLISPDGNAVIIHDSSDLAGHVAQERMLSGRIIYQIPDNTQHFVIVHEFDVDTLYMIIELDGYGNILPAEARPAD